mgnify:CR=1 FL=1
MVDLNGLFRMSLNVREKKMERENVLKRREKSWKCELKMNLNYRKRKE